MFARSTTIHGNPKHVDAGVAMVREQVQPALEDLPGCLGVSMLVDRETGGCIVTSSWDSEDAMHAAEPQVGAMRDRASRVLGGRAEVREWEIAVLHRMRPAPQGAFARVTWSTVDVAAVDATIDYMRHGVLPQVEDLPGFCSASLMVDRRTGMGALAVVYADRDALILSRVPADAIRDDASRRIAAREVDVADFEVALAHLRVPATA